MPKKQYRQRLDALFSDVERLVANPNYTSPRVRKELEALTARLRELEAQIAESEKATGLEAIPPVAAPQTASETRPAAPQILYEKEQVGYVFSGDVLEDLQGEPPIAANSDKTIVVPFVSGSQVIGKMQVEPPTNQKWTSEEDELIQAIAKQASQQIQNLRLLAATENARAEAEAATRRFMHENWDAYLDAIHHSERIGYAYDQTSVTPYTDPTLTGDGIKKTVKVMEEHIGNLFVKPDPVRPLTEQDKEMVAAIANQVAQQVENIRLLADATRARAEAEEATRRLTRENWDAYVSQKETQPGFLYNSNQVIPIHESPAQKDLDLSQPLKVRGEIIGQLAVAGIKDISPEAAEIAVAIAERASVHLETLRLSEEIQKRATELETVAKVSTTASTVLNPDELLQSVVDLTQKRFGLYHAHVYLANDAWNTLILAAGAGETGKAMVAEQHTISLAAEKSLVARAARQRKAVIVNDVQADPEFLAHPLLPDTRAEMAVPIIVADKVLGVFDVQSDKPNRFTDEDANIYTTLTSQVGVALQNARLYAEQAATLSQLRELDRLKSSFLANMSHELRTPLNSILGFADVMIEELDGPLTENMSNDLKLIQKNGQHLLHLINDVLDMAKIEAGRMNLNPERFRIHDLLEEVNSITSPLASEKNLALFIENDSDPYVEILADRTRIRQVMINLVNNAMKFTEKGQISLRAIRRDELITVSVCDTGVGIPPDKLEDVFQEFTQVDTSTTRKAGGTGLGLPISRKLIEMHGGRLWAESTGVEGEGATFFVELPLEAVISEAVEVEKVQK